MTTMPLATVRDNLSDLVEDIHGTHERVVITRNGEPAAVLVSVEDLAGLEETIDVLSDPASLRQLRESEDSLERGEHGLGAAELAAFLAAHRDRPVETAPTTPKG